MKDVKTLEKNGTNNLQTLNVVQWAHLQSNMCDSSCILSESGRKENSTNSGSSSSSASSTPGNLSSPTINGGAFFTSNLKSQIKDLETAIKEDFSEIKSSRLSKTLAEVIKDNEALTYFVQYLEAIGCGALIKFILDVESFNSALFSSAVKEKSNKNNISSDIENELKGFSLDENEKKIGNDENVSQLKNILNHDNKSDIGCDECTSVTTSCKNGFEEEELEENELISRLLNPSRESESFIDAVKIFWKYFSHKAPLKINVEPVVRKRLVENLKTNVNKNLFLEVKECIFKTLEKEHFNDYLRSEYHCKYQIDVLTSDKVFISDILYNETALFYIMEFLEQEGCTSLLEFWISAINFQQQYEEKGKNYDPLQAQSDAMVLYDKYFSLQATNPLNLGDDIRIKIEESICREEGPLPNCFEYPRKLIVKLLEQNYLQPFLRSQLYFKYLSELISTIHSNLDLGSRSRHSGESDCSSEVSISATNTLLACEDTNPPKKLFKHLNSSSLSIDTQQLYDPDSLWRRGPKRKGLNFGRINALGRFETDFEPEPDKKEESKITKAVKKLVNLNEDKSKEEMAWQVAAMIVKDVTNITMPSSSES